MLTREENEFLTRVGPGTPAGELLRRYWHPIAVARELSEENPTKLVRILGEDLALFRDRKGRVGLLADHCSHRGVSLGVYREDHPMIDTKLAEAMVSGQYGNRPSKKIWTLKEEDRRHIVGNPSRANLARNLA